LGTPFPRLSATKRMPRLFVVLGVALLSVALATGAGANASSPISTPAPTATKVVNANGTVTVTVHGRWKWSYDSVNGDGSGATASHHCGINFGVGWALVWHDSDDLGYAETYHLPGRMSGPSRTVHVGSLGKTSLRNAEGRLSYNTLDPCGKFTQTNVPAPGDGFDSGVWHGTHVYANSASVPAAVCVITYDLGTGGTPMASRLLFPNNDNSVAWSLMDFGAWNTNPRGPNCVSLTNAVPPPTTTTTTKPTTTTTTHPTTTTTTHPTHPATTTTTHPTHIATTSADAATGGGASTASSSGSTLAFTGWGLGDQLLSFAGIALILLGLLLYLLDRESVLRVARWLLGM
jgi:hypothetical protein